MLDPLELTGRARTHVVQLDALRCALHQDVVEPFAALRAAAARDGIDIRVLSAFRDFSAQLSIWNRKFSGQRPLFARDGSLLQHASLARDELIEAILNWSALPGASRHHWGSDLDVFDAAAVAPDYRVQLLPEEFAEGGPFAQLHRWLDGNAARFGFFWPYDRDRGGVHPEPWHISHAATALPALDSLTPELIAETLRAEDVLGRDAVLERLEDIFRRYVVNVARPETVQQPQTLST
jgi:LAS superfamily LD-carboxypeptidase LdcB